MSGGWSGATSSTASSRPTSCSTCARPPATPTTTAPSPGSTRPARPPTAAAGSTVSPAGRRPGRWWPTAGRPSADGEPGPAAGAPVGGGGRGQRPERVVRGPAGRPAARRRLPGRGPPGQPPLPGAGRPPLPPVPGRPARPGRPGRAGRAQRRPRSPAPGGRGRRGPGGGHLRQLPGALGPGRAPPGDRRGGRDGVRRQRHGVLQPRAELEGLWVSRAGRPARRSGGGCQPLRVGVLGPAPQRPRAPVQPGRLGRQRARDQRRRLPRHALELASTRVVALFLETVRDPAAFRAALARAAARAIPVVALKVGRGRAARAMVAAHSGALAGEDGAYQALFDAYGVARVATLDELADTCELLAGRRAGPGALAAIHDSGGERAHLLDMAERLRVPLAELSGTTRARLEAVLEPGLPATNPLDAWGTGNDADRIFATCIRALLDDPATAALALNLDLTTEPTPDTSYTGLATEAAAATDKPVAVLANLASAVDRAEAATLRAAGVPVLEGTATGLAHPPPAAGLVAAGTAPEPAEPPPAPEPAEPPPAGAVDNPGPPRSRSATLPHRGTRRRRVGVGRARERWRRRLAE